MRQWLRILAGDWARMGLTLPPSGTLPEERAKEGLEAAKMSLGGVLLVRLTTFRVGLSS